MRICKAYITTAGAVLYESPEEYQSKVQAASQVAGQLNDKDSALCFETVDGQAVSIRVDKIDHVQVEEASVIEAMLREADEDA